MVQVDGGNDTNLHAQLPVDLLGNGFKGFGAGDIHIDGTRVGLATSRNGSRSGCGVRCERVGIIGHCGACGFKVHEVQVLRSIQGSPLVVVQTGLSQEIILVLQCAQKVGSRLNLGIAHAVTDEQEYVLGCRYRPDHRHGGLHFRLILHLGSGGSTAGILIATARKNTYAQAQRQQQCNNFSHFGFTSIYFRICVFHDPQFTGFL